MSTDALSVSGVLTREHLQTYQAHMKARVEQRVNEGGGLQRSFLLLMSLAAGSVVLWYLAAWTIESFAFFWCGVAAGGALLMSVALTKNRLATELMLEHGDFRRGEMTLTVDAAGLRSETPHATTSFSWGDLSEYEQFGSIDVIWVDALNGLVIPHSVFSSADERDAFRSFCKGFLAAK